MARPRSTYTAEYKLSAVKMITEQKLSVAEVCERLKEFKPGKSGSADELKRFEALVRDGGMVETSGLSQADRKLGLSRDCFGFYLM